MPPTMSAVVKGLRPLGGGGAGIAEGRERRFSDGSGSTGGVSESASRYEEVPTFTISTGCVKVSMGGAGFLGGACVCPREKSTGGRGGTTGGGGVAGGSGLGGGDDVAGLLGGESADGPTGTVGSCLKSHEGGGGGKGTDEGTTGGAETAGGGVMGTGSTGGAGLGGAGAVSLTSLKSSLRFNTSNSVGVMAPASSHSFSWRSVARGEGSFSIRQKRQVNRSRKHRQNAFAGYLRSSVETRSRR